MSRFINDTSGMLGLPLSQIGLFLATTILLVVVLSLISCNQWQRTAEIQSIASGFCRAIEQTDRLLLEQKTTYLFPRKDYAYQPLLSSRSIVILSQGFLQNTLSLNERFLLDIWPRTSHDNWTTSEQLHDYLQDVFGHNGTQGDPLPSPDYTVFYQHYSTSAGFFAMNPYSVTLAHPVFLQKATIYTKNDTKHDFILVYQ